MRRCERFQEVMIDLALVNVSHGDTHVVKKSDSKIKHLGKVTCAVCPTCGDISLYLDDLTRLKKHLENI